VDVLCEVLELKGIIKTDSELQTSALKFKNSRSPPNPLNGCIGAMDGIAIKIMKPNNDLNPAQFYFRKNFMHFLLKPLWTLTIVFYIAPCVV